QRHAGLLLAGPPPRPRHLGDGQVAFAFRRGGRSLAFVCNDAAEPARVRFGGRHRQLAPRSAQVFEDGRLRLDTAHVRDADRIARRMRPAREKLRAFAWRAEPPAEARDDGAGHAVVVPRPVEQLRLTADATDYCWYSTDLHVGVREAGPGMLRVRGVADVVYVYVDGVLCATTRPPLVENRGPLRGRGFEQTFSLELARGRHTLSLLCCALGLIKGDWQIGWRNMVAERKGIWRDVHWRGRRLPGPWTLRSGLVGEPKRWWDESGTAAGWRTGRVGIGRPLTWWRTTFARPRGGAPLALDLAGMNKGLAWVNGRCIGRYWLIAAAAQPSGDTVGCVGAGQPTQRYYHVPREWLTDENTLVLFEEAGGDPCGVRLCAWG
ncbi:MAG: hypothetical protein PHR35_20550, partial [Kiritimatiellae bacterium]|nr:hypothetical protein [Kiritimatiellia bacterium]